MRSSRDVRLGFVGLGRRGAPMCAPLVRAGCPVPATALRPDAPTGGARRAGTTAELAAETDVLITMLPGPPEVVTVMEGAPPALPSRAVWVGLTSHSPAVVAPVRERALAGGVEVLEAPVGGGPPAA